MTKTHKIFFMPSALEAAKIYEKKFKDVVVGGMREFANTQLPDKSKLIKSTGDHVYQYSVQRSGHTMDVFFTMYPDRIIIDSIIIDNLMVV